MMSLSLDEPRPIDSRGRASPPGEASSGELSGELFCFESVTYFLEVSDFVAVSGDAVLFVYKVTVCCQ